MIPGEQVLPLCITSWTVRRVVREDSKPQVEVLLTGIRSDSNATVHLLLNVGECESLVSFAQKALERAKEEASR